MRAGNKSIKALEKKREKQENTAKRQIGTKQQKLQITTSKSKKCRDSSSSNKSDLDLTSLSGESDVNDRECLFGFNKF